MWADKPFGKWNKLRIIQTGAITTVYLNKKLVVDKVVMENFWDRDLPLIAKGPVQFQTHGGEIRWRNVFIREIPADEANAMLAGRDADGFEAVFNGRDFSGWSGRTGNYEVKYRTIMCKSGKGGTIFTQREYADFIVRL